MKNKLHKIVEWYLSLLLHLANRDVSFINKEKFYKLKKELLNKYGNFHGYDVQHFTNFCFACDGDGKFWTGDIYPPRKCFKCKGTGIYEEIWIYLEKYTFGKHQFHIPGLKSYKKPIYPFNKNIIEGKIEHHTPRFHVGKEACLWLFLFFDYKTFKEEMKQRIYCFKAVTPLMIYRNLISRYQDWKMKRKFNQSIDDLPF